MANQIASFNDTVTQQVFLARVNKLAEEMAKEMGVDINRVGNVAANSSVITFNIVFKIKNSKPETKTHSYEYKTGKILSSEIIVGFKFLLKGTLYTVRGFNPRNYKNSVSLTRDYDGKGFKTSYDMICNNGKRYDK